VQIVVMFNRNYLLSEGNQKQKKSLVVCFNSCGRSSIQNVAPCMGQTSGACSTGHLEQNYPIVCNLI
jgi:hypothetical protein